MLILTWLRRHTHTTWVLLSMVVTLTFVMAPRPLGVPVVGRFIEDVHALPVGVRVSHAGDTLGGLQASVWGAASGLDHFRLNQHYPSPPLLGSAALIYDDSAGRTLYAVNADTPLPIASTTKLMTALLTLEYGHLDTLATVSYNAATIGQSTMGLYEGEQVSLHDLLYGLLLPSGNDAAITIAEAVGGSEAAFVAMMNARCQRLGCTHTHFTTPHGLDEPGHYGSAHDLLLIAQADMRYSLFRTIVRTRMHTVAATAHNGMHYLVNVNQPLWWYPGVKGIKPGNTDAAGFCDVLYVQRGKRRLFAVFLGMPDRYTDVRDLLNYGLQNFDWRSPALKTPVYPLEDFSQDTRDRYLSGQDPSGKAWRYYVGTGYYVRPPFLNYYAYHPELGLPTSAVTSLGDATVQRFGATVLIYHSKTDTLTTVT